MPQYLNGPRTIFVIEHIIDPGVFSRDPKEMRKLPTTVVAAALTSEVEACRAYEIINGRKGLAFPGISAVAMRAVDILVIGDKAYYEVGRKPYPTSMIAKNAEEAVALYVEMLIRNEYIPRVAPPGPIELEPVSVANIPINAAMLEVAINFDAVANVGQPVL